MLFQKKKDVIGIDVGSSSIKMVHLKEAKGSFQLASLGLDNALVVTESVAQNLYLSARNLHRVDVRDVAGLDPVSLIAFDKVLITVPALKKVEEMLS